MGFGALVIENALVACGRHCCLCHKFCGIKMEIHHIKPQAEGGPDTFENAIPLCFDCHGDMRTYDSKHPKGIKYTEKELIRHRDAWYLAVQNNSLIINQHAVETDKTIYNTLLQVLPWNGSLSFISQNNFAGFSFQLDRLNDLNNFEYLCTNPAFHFLDADLEGLRSTLLSSIGKFQAAISINTFPTINMGWNQVPPEWEEDNYEEFWKIVNLIHGLAKEICENYNQLIRMATVKLGILPDFDL